MIRSSALALVLLVSATSATGQTQDHPPAALPSSTQMTHDRGESWTFVAQDLNLSSYTRVIIDPAVVYSGPDAQFGDISAQDRRRFADMVTEQLRAEVSKVLPLETRPGPGIARLRITLLGMTETTGGVATATRATPLGLATSAMKSVAGRQGSFTGSMLFAIELFDTRNDDLLVAAVRRRAPDALDIPATISTTETVRAIARDLADNVRGRFESGNVR